MRGLMSPAASPLPEKGAGQPAGQPPGQPVQPPQQQGGAAPKGGDDQATYDKFVKNGMRLIYRKDDASVKSMLASLDGNGNPLEGLANTVGTLVMRLTSSAEQKGASIPPNVVLRGAGELLEQLADYSKQSGGHEYTDQELQSVAKVMVQAMAGGGQQGEQPVGQPAGQPAGPQMNGAPAARRGLMA